MILKKSTITIVVRILAVFSLMIGLSDAANLLGVSTGAQSPTLRLGVGNFIYLAVFTVATTFAAVGLWIKASWGAVLLVTSMATQLGLVIFSDIGFGISWPGFLVRLLLLIGGAAIIAYAQWQAYDPVYE